MLQAENIVKWTVQRNKSENWAAWAKDNPERNAMLLQCEKYLND